MRVLDDEILVKNYHRLGCIMVEYWTTQGNCEHVKNSSDKSINLETYFFSEITTYVPYVPV